MRKNKICFVLEGGALRGLYTAGVLDALYENKIDIDCIIGVSAGALFGVNYFSNQPKRVLRYNKRFCNDKRYISIRSLILTGNVVNKNFAYYKVTKELDPFDQDAFVKTGKPFYAVATNMETGKAEYILLEKPIDQLEELRATSAMPLLSKIVKIGDKKYLDGDKIVVVLTQPEGFVKQELNDKQLNKIKKKYKKYPNFIETSINRPKEYNKTLNYISKKEKSKDIFVFKPNKSIEINPIKKTPEQLDEIYNLGYEDGINRLKELKNYLK